MLFYIISFTFHITNFVHTHTRQFPIASVVWEFMAVLLSKEAALETKLRQFGCLGSKQGNQIALCDQVTVS